MRGKLDSQSANRIKSFLISFFIIAFFVSIILVYYNELMKEKRLGIIKDGEISARQVETQLDKYLSTGIDAMELAAYTLDGMLDEGRSGSEILDYLT